MIRRAFRDERGSVTLFAVSCLSLLLVLGAALGVVAATVKAHRMAQSAADLSAIAGAARGRRWRRTPARRSAAVAAANGARLAHLCTWRGAIAGRRSSFRTSVAGSDRRPHRAGRAPDPRLRPTGVMAHSRC